MSAFFYTTLPMKCAPKTRKIRTVFLIDREYDSFMVWNMLRASASAEFFALARGMGIDSATACSLRNSPSYETCSGRIETIAKKRYASEAALLATAPASYKKEWEKISDAFYSAIAEITGTAWRLSEYTVVLSLFHSGISNRNGSVVLRSAREDCRKHARITAHEILMTHLWHIFEQVFGKKAVAQNESFYWQANEITTVALLGLEEKVNTLWAKDQRGFDRFLLNYPELEPLKNILKERYAKKRSFLGYLKDMRSLSR